MKTENKKPENPSAFPVSGYAVERGMYNLDKDIQGMTLRDYFANSIMQSYVKEHLELLRENKFGYTVSDMAESSYLIADAMLKQREL